MLPVLATSFTVASAQDEQPAATYDRVKRIVQSQAEMLIRRFEPDMQLEWKSSTAWRSANDLASLRWSEWQQAETGALVDCRLTYTLKKQCPWEVELKFGFGQTTGELQVSGVWRSSQPVATDWPLNDLPPLLRAMTKESCQTVELAIPYSLHRIQPEDVPIFYTDVFKSHERRVPLILVAPTTYRSRSLIDAGKLAQRMLGLAVVYEFVNDHAAQVFRQVAGPHWACYDGVVRVYWPREIQATTHRYWKLRSIDQGVVQDELFQLVRDASRRNAELPDFLRWLEQQRGENEHQQRQEIMARLQREERDNSQLEQVWQSTLEERDRLKQDHAELRRRNEDLQFQILELQDRLRAAEENLTAAWKSEPPIEDVDGAIAGGHEEGPALLLSQQAWESYRGASPDQREEFEKELRKLWTKPAIRQSQSKRIRGRKTDCLVFPQGGTDVRMFYYEREDGSVCVCELGDHAYYDQLLDNARVFKRSYPDEGFVAMETSSWPAEAA